MSNERSSHNPYADVRGGIRKMSDTQLIMLALKYLTEQTLKDRLYEAEINVLWRELDIRAHNP